jgi:hypothetical protein
LPVKVMPEGNDTQGGEPGSAPEGPTDRRSGAPPPKAGVGSEGDLLAERRARRAAESGEVVLTRRAEAAEATVQTLERHVASLQQRLRDAEDEQRLMAELLEVEKAAALEREHELRRVKQREYAEQQLRVEAEDRLVGLDRESRAEIERVSRRLGGSERDAVELAGRLEGVQRQLAEAEQAAAAERAAVRHAEHELQARLGELERRASEMQHGLAAERVARERSERLLESMREGHRRMEGLVGEMKGIVVRLTAAFGAGRRPDMRPDQAATPQPHLREGPVPGEARSTEPGPSARAAAAEARGAEMADALAAAVERLRARAEAAHVAEQSPPARAVVRPPHKHSMSLIKRWRIRRKQRRER